MKVIEIGVAKHFACSATIDMILSDFRIARTGIVLLSLDPVAWETIS